MINSKVIKRVDMRNDKVQEKWEGEYTIISFDKRSGRYKLLDMVEKLYKKAIPINYLKLIEYLDEKREKEQWLEVKKILYHRDDPDKRENLVS